MDYQNIIIQENNNSATVTDVLKRSVVAIGFFVGCAYSDQGIPALNQSLNAHPLIQRDNTSYVSPRKKDDTWLVSFDGLPSTGITVKVPILKAPIVGYTDLRNSFPEEMGENAMGAKDNDKIIRKPTSKSTQRKNWNEVASSLFQSSRKFNSEETRIYSEALNKRFEVEEKLF